MSEAHEEKNKPELPSKSLPSFVFNNAAITAEKVTGKLLNNYSKKSLKT